MHGLTIVLDSGMLLRHIESMIVHLYNVSGNLKVYGYTANTRPDDATPENRSILKP